MTACRTYPTSITLGGVALTADVDFYASRRADKNELWLTVAKDLSGPANRLILTP